MSRARADLAAVLIAAPIAALTVLWSSSASADGGDDEPLLLPSGTGDPIPTDPGLRGHHQGQFGLGLSLTTGYRFIKTWDSDRYCGDRASPGDGGGNAAYCFDRTPLGLDVSLSYGVTKRLELMLDIRLGLERDFGTTTTADGPRLRHYAPGLKFWLSAPGQLNYFSTAQVAIDATGYTDLGGDSLGADVRLRNANGLQVDFHAAYGAYLYFAEEVAFRRWLEVGVEGGAGIQGRFP